jgi:MFS family permease
MYDLILFLVLAFSFGLFRGGTFCSVCCGPGMASYIIAKNISFRRSILLGLIFNIPRIAILTTVGGIIGYLGFFITQAAWYTNMTLNIGIFGYLLIGIFLIGLGVYMRMNSVQALQCKPGEKEKFKIRNETLVKLLGKRKTGTNMFVLWGIIMTVACITETTILEGVVIAGVAGTFASTPLSGMLIGAASLFLLSVGTMIPILIITGFSGKMSQNIKDVQILETVKNVGSYITMAIGLILFISTLVYYFVA